MIRKCEGKIHLCYVIMDIIRISSISLLFYNVIYIYLYKYEYVSRDGIIFIRFVFRQLKRLLKKKCRPTVFFTVNSADNTGHGQD